MKLSRILVLLFSFPLACSAQTIQGYVENGTTNKPQSGIQVTLFTPTGEKAIATTGDQGVFQLPRGGNLTADSVAVLKVAYGGVDYFQTLGKGQSTKVNVYDASSKVSAIGGYFSVVQIQARGKLLQVTELHALNNTSTPPLTRVNSDNVLLDLPKGAKVEPATVSSPDGGTTKLTLLPIDGEADRYWIDFPLKPGMTKYAIHYEVPYEGKLIFSRRVQYPTKRIGIILPDSMSFQSVGAKRFHSREGQAGTHEEVLESLAANDPITFEVRGSGALSHFLRPLNAGEAPTPVRAKTLNAPPHGGFAVSGTNQAHSQPGYARNQITLYAGILVLAAMLFWRFTRKRVSQG
jgi:hypothetical protein